MRVANARQHFRRRALLSRHPFVILLQKLWPLPGIYETLSTIDADGPSGNCSLDWTIASASGMIIAGPVHDKSAQHHESLTHHCSRGRFSVQTWIYVTSSELLAALSGPYIIHGFNINPNSYDTINLFRTLRDPPIIQRSLKQSSYGRAVRVFKSLCLTKEPNWEEDRAFLFCIYRPFFDDSAINHSFTQCDGVKDAYRYIISIDIYAQYYIWYVSYHRKPQKPIYIYIYSHQYQVDILHRISWYDMIWYDPTGRYRALYCLPGTTTVQPKNLNIGDS